MTDIVIPLGKGSTWNDNELKYSLRGIEKHFSYYGTIYIVGDLPHFVNFDAPGIRYIPYHETANNHNENIREKILHACLIPQLSDDFLFMNDDHFMMQSFTLPDFPYYNKGTLEEWKHHKNGWDLADLMWTQTKIGVNALNFDTHTPIIYNKKLFVEKLSKLEPVGYQIKSMYCGLLGITGEYKADGKLYRRHTTQELQDITKDIPCFSMSDRAICYELESFLKYLYPSKSKYEK